MVFGVIVGTGTGGGIVVDRPCRDRRQRDRGRVGTQSAAGADATTSGRGRRVTAGGAAASRRSCRGPALSRDYAAFAGGETSLTTASASIVETEEATPRDRARASGETLRATRSLATKSGWRARSAAIINVLDPDVIVLGGGLSNIERLYESVPRLWAPYVFSDRVDTRLVRADAWRLERRARRGVVVE